MQTPRRQKITQLLTECLHRRRSRSGR